MQESNTQKPKYRVTTLGALGAVASAISIFSLLQHTLEFGLASSLFQLVEFYREMGRWVFGWIGLPFGIDIPRWLIDFWVLSAVGVGITSRAAFRDEFPAKPGSHPFWHSSTFILLPLGVLTLIGVLCLLGAVLMPIIRLSNRFSGFEMPERQSIIVDLTLQEVFTFSCLLLVFFAMNAFGI